MGRNCSKQRRWFITGVSRGLGRRVAEMALARGHFVAGSVRREDALREFEELAPGRSLAYFCDINQPERTQCTVARSSKALDGVDVVFHSAGYGLLGCFEELSEEEARRHFETHFWATWRIMHKFLPQFRERGYGHFVNVVCSGYRGPAWGAIEAANAAITSLCETIAAEAGPSGVRVTLVDVGPLQGEWRQHVERSQTELEAYAGLREHAEQLLERRGRPIQVVADLILEQVETCRSQALLKITPDQAARVLNSDR
ncbi:SDR family oxidoreductase [bacterium]|nr:SDR family oxidoreductase [bacterium]